MKPEIEIIDNYLPQEIFDNIQKMMLSDTFPWFLERHSVYDQDGFSQFVHAIYREFEPVSEAWKQIQYILNYLQPHGLYRIKANGTPAYSKVVEKPLHVDLKEPDGSTTPHEVMILYVNTNDGYTVFEDGTKVESVANRALFFNGKYKHAGTNCTDQPIRIVLNFDYL